MVDLVVLEKQRGLITGALTDVTDGEWFAIPRGRRNNLAWNLAHIVTVQQVLSYGLSQMPLCVPEEYRKLYARDTSPEAWTSPPDVLVLLEQLRTLPARTREDYDAGRFAGFQPYTTGTGIRMDSVEEAMAFNNFHEGIHLGIMMSIKRELRSGV